jgi:hypothetical protein
MSEKLYILVMGQSNAVLGRLYVQGELDPIGAMSRAKLHYAHATAKDHARPVRVAPKGRMARRASFAALMKRCREVARHSPNAWYSDRLRSLVDTMAQGEKP